MLALSDCRGDTKAMSFTPLYAVDAANLSPSHPPYLSLIVARARNGVIGQNGGLPWRLKKDLKWFKAQTLGKPIVMGRTTWDSLPNRPLPGRPNLVVSRSLTQAVNDAWLYTDLDVALVAARAMAVTLGAPEVMVIGGEQIYRAVLTKVDRVYLTEVAFEPEGDAFFPQIDPNEWTEQFCEHHEKDHENEVDFTFRVLQRSEAA
jgi:dihydrofolate reductase